MGKQRSITRKSAQAGVDKRDAHGRTALHRAAHGGDRQRVAQLLEAGADVEARTEQGQTPLHLAAAVGPVDLLPLLITPTTLEAEDNGGRTALQLAVSRTSSRRLERRRRGLGAVNVLLEAGASPAAALFGTNPGQTAFTSVDWEQQVNLMLLGGMLAGPRPAGLVAEALRWRDGEGDTLLHLGAMNGCQQLVAQLVKAGANRDAVNELRITPLWDAAVAGHAHLVPLLATPGNINLPDKDSCYTPLQTAAESGQNEELVAALLAEGAMVRTQGDCVDYKDSLLTIAAQGASSGVITLLLGALAKECGQQEGRQQQKEGQSELVLLVAAAVVQYSRDLQDGARCAQLLEMVLDVLGPGVAGEVCLAVQEQLQQEWELEDGAAGVAKGSALAEALLLGWLVVEERLHAARQSLLARLQRLVPAVRRHHHHAPYQQQENCELLYLLFDLPECPFLEEGAHWATASSLVEGWAEPKQLVQYAALAGAAGHQQEALSLLGKFAARHVLQGRRGNCIAGCVCSTGCLSRQASQCRFREGLQYAACALSGLPDLDHCGFWEPGDCDRYEHATSFHPPGVYTTFLAAWVKARRQLQQLPNEVTRAVVAAVMAAQQQQQ